MWSKTAGKNKNNIGKNKNNINRKCKAQSIMGTPIL